MKIGTSKVILNDDRFFIVDMDDDNLPLVEIYFKKEFKHLSVNAKQSIVEHLSETCMYQYNKGNIDKENQLHQKIK